MEKSFVNFSRFVNLNRLFGFTVFNISENTLNKVDNVVRNNINNNKTIVINLLSYRYLASSVNKYEMERLKTKTTDILNIVDKELED